MFKSCDYCRHVKKKCVLPHPSAGRCKYCEHLNLVCKFSPRQPSLKRRRTSQQLSFHLSAAESPVSAHSTWRGPYSGALSISKDGDCQLGPAGSSRAKTILKDDATLNNNALDSLKSTAEKYWHYVHPITPFLSDEMMVECDTHSPPALQNCIELAAVLWLHRKQTQNLKQQACQLMEMMAHGEISLPVLGGSLLLLLRVPFDDELIQLASTLHFTLPVAKHWLTQCR